MQNTILHQAKYFLKNLELISIFKFVLLIAVLIGFLIRGSDQMSYHWQWYRVSKYILTVENGTWTPGPLLAGLGITLQICGLSLGLASLLGLVAASFRLSGSFLANGIARVYLELIRNTPLLVQIFFIYFVLSPIFDFSRFAAAVWALSLFEGAYASEIFRAGIISVSREQWEASYSLGMNTGQTYWYIILPQAVRQVLPPLTSQAVSLIKDSALVSTIAIYDLTMQGQAIIAETYLTFEIWFTVAAIYLVLTLSFSGLANLLEKRMRTGHY